jgi:hypothetical protein
MEDGRHSYLVLYRLLGLLLVEPVEVGLVLVEEWVLGCWPNGSVYVIY